MSSPQLFPHRLTRRDFVKMSAASATALAVPALARAGSAPVKIGAGVWTYTLDPEWGRLPAGMQFGLGCGIVVDGRDRVIVTSRSANPCVAIYGPSGELEETWSNYFAKNVGLSTEEVAASAHGIYWSKEPGGEFLYFTENAVKEKPFGKRVYKTDLQGRVLYTLGNVERDDSTHQKFDWTNPTDVAVAPNGDVYVVDGYGSQRVSRFDKNFKHLRTIGTKTDLNKKGVNAPHGTFLTCHGVWVSTLRSEPEVYIADRTNGRYEVFDLELNYKRTVAGDFVRNPCCFYQHAGHLYVADLGALVTILDAQDRPVARLGDGRGVKKPATEAESAPHADKFFTPHALTVDSKGNLYVLEWIPWGRVRKFTHTPA